MPDRPPEAFSRRRNRLLAGAALILVASAALVLVDVQHQASRIVERVSDHHRLLALSLARDASARLSLSGQAAVEQLFNDARALEREGELLVLFRFPGETGHRATDGRILATAPIDAAVAAGRGTALLTRDEAAYLGLPRRQAIAGVAAVERGGTHGPVGLAVVSSIARERDHIAHERWRAIVSLGFVSALAAVFAIVGVWQNRRELQLTAAVAHQRLERERDEQLARADRMATLAALSLGIAHELATPLGVISARVEQIGAAGAGNASIEKSTRVIGEQIARMRAVMQGFLALARGDAPARSSVASGAVAAEAADLVRHRFEAAGVALRTDVDATSTVRCDPALIVQTLANVLVNACQASARGQTVSLVVRDDAAAGRVRFVVEDEGVGMKDEEMARATAPFFTTRSREGGTGLGLAIAAEITQHHGGTFTLAHGDPRGLRAIIELPVEPVEPIEKEAVA